jgi:hypothetical protein
MAIAVIALPAFHPPLPGRNRLVIRTCSFTPRYY